MCFLNDICWELMMLFVYGVFVMMVDKMVFDGGFDLVVYEWIGEVFWEVCEKWVYFG